LEPGDAARARTLFGEIAERRNKLKALEQGPAGWLGSFAQPGPTHRLYRGDPFQEREEVEPGGLSVLGSLGLPSDAPEAERRLRLGEWITSDARALAARVIVNRIWHYHFGTGIVDTPSDFGINGTPPSHPELLEWLATEFIRSGWSLKHLHRLILTSATFRQDSQPNPAAIQRTAGCSGDIHRPGSAPKQSGTACFRHRDRSICEWEALDFSCWMWWRRM
jgi:hypothetical protein